MGAIERYEPHIVIDHLVGDFVRMRSADCGNYVLYCDHVARIADLEARLAAAERARDEARADGALRARCLEELARRTGFDRPVGIDAKIEGNLTEACGGGI